MPLVKCKDCGGQLAYSATRCPHCGSTRFLKPVSKVNWPAMIGFIFLAGGALIVLGNVVAGLFNWVFG